MFGVLITVLCSIFFAAHSVHQIDDLHSILEGVNLVKGASQPGALIAYGEYSFPVCVGEEGGNYKAFITGTLYGNGKIVSFGHSSFVTRFINETTGYDNEQLLANSFRWAGGSGATQAGILVYGDNVALVEEILSRIGVAAVQLQANQLTNLTYLGEHDILIINNGINQAAATAINTFVGNGGGLILGATPWAWVAPPGTPFRDHFWANLILQNTGTIYIPKYSYPTVSGNVYNASTVYLQDVHSANAWQNIKIALQNQNFSSSRFTQQFSTLHDTIFYAVPENELIAEIDEEFLKLPTYVPTEVNPVTEEKEKSLLVAYQYFTEIANDFQMAGLRKHPSADIFPGPVPSQVKSLFPKRHSIAVEIKSYAPSWTYATENGQSDEFVPTESVFYHDKNGEQVPIVNDMVGIENKYTAWQSTGLYALPGEVIQIEVSNSSVIDSSQLRIQVGVHTDNIQGQSRWNRFHKIVYRKNLSNNGTEIVNPFGGLVLIDVARLQNQTFNLSVSGAVPSPTYFIGKTILAEWRNTIRYHPAPWGELVGENIILSVRKGSLEVLDDPEELVQLWDEVLNAIADLAAIPRQRVRPERIVLDVQISAGWMHSGYPIMGFLSVESATVNVTAMRLNTAEFWGHFHELGHNHQKSDWTFQGTGEVTCNLFALYVMHTVFHKPTNTCHPNLSDASVSGLLRDYVSGGTDYSQWKSSPFLALITYIQLQEKYGWSAYKNVFSVYHKLSSNERPTTDQNKIDLWMTLFSKEVEENLTPYFRSWGIPITNAAEQNVSHLPETEIRIRNP